MTTSLDKTLVPAAFNIIEKLGTNMTFTIVTDEGTFDPATNSISGVVEQTFVRKASPPSKFSQKFLNGKTIKENDLKTVVAAQDIPLAPQLNMKVVHAGITYKGLVINPLFSGDDIAAWIVRLRA